MIEGHLEITAASSASAGSICAVAIVRDELPFLDEWLAYHRLLGIGHFYLYDDDPTLPLAAFLSGYRDHVTVIDWHGRGDHLPGRNRQLKAYKEALARIGPGHQWVTFLDIDEFIVLPSHADLPTFLIEYERFGQVSLPWLTFGHSGFFDDPTGLITTALTWRAARCEPRHKAVKSITRVRAIADIFNGHFCRLKRAFERADVRELPLRDPGVVAGADLPHINHYFCRSFSRWMRRPERGAVTDAVAYRYRGEDWKLHRPGCLRQFVEVVAREYNRCEDQSMLKFEQPIKSYLAQYGVVPGRGMAQRTSALDWVKAPLCIRDDELVVYTAIAGGYDTLKEQNVDGVELVAFLDEPASSSTWHIRLLDHCSDDPNRNAKVHKVLSHKYFPEKAYSLWVDGSVTMMVSPRALAEMFLGDFDMVVHRHARRGCTYREAAACCWRPGADDPAVIRSHMARYWRFGFPRGMGLFENMVILRRHNDRVRQFNELWWSEIQRGSRRDQLSAVFAASQVGLKVGFFPGSPWSGSSTYNGFFRKTPHLKQHLWRASDVTSSRTRA